MAPMLDEDIARVLDVEGPIRADVFMVWLNDGHIEITGPDGPNSWVLQLEDAEHPVETVGRIVAGLVGTPLLVHSTSWRREGNAVTLTFLVVIGPKQVGGMDSRPVARSDLARSEATRAPMEIGEQQVLEHALRHLAWLATDDPVASQRLDSGWKAALADYVPEPFRSFA